MNVDAPCFVPRAVMMLWVPENCYHPLGICESDIPQVAFNASRAQWTPLAEAIDDNVTWQNLLQTRDLVQPVPQHSATRDNVQQLIEWCDDHLDDVLGPVLERINYLDSSTK